MWSQELWASVRRLQVVTRRQVANVMGGAYASVFRGRGMEFDEVRPYVPGDDVRTIDWNVTARTGEAYVKRYMEERQLTVMLVVDISASQDFGSKERSKLYAAAEVAALLAMAAEANGDNVGLLLFHREAELFIPPRKGEKHSLRVMRELLARGSSQGQAADALGRASGLAHAAMPNSEVRSWPKWWQRTWYKLTARRAQAPTRGTSISAALQFCRSVLPRRTVLFLITDFLDDGYLLPLRLANRKHDLVGVWLTDPRETEFPVSGLVTLQDLETGAERVIDTRDASFANELAQQSNARREQLMGALRQSGIDSFEVSTSRSVVEPVLRFFRDRAKRRMGGRS